MYKRIAAILVSLAVIAGLTGCKPSTGTQKVVTPNAPKPDKAQAVVAISPVMSYDDGTAVIAFNDIKNAIQQDRKSASLSALNDGTDFCWAYMSGSDWQKRGIYDLSKWSNGKGAAIKTLNAYSFSDDATDSLMAFTAKSANIETYGEDAVPDYGLILSTGQSTREALIYTVPQSGTLSLQSGSITAVQAVDGVKTGFLAEDGTARSAVLRIDINSKRYYSGSLVNSTAAEDSAAVTSLTYPELYDIPVNEGDLVLFSIEFNGTVNADDDISRPDEPGDTVSDTPSSSGNSSKTSDRNNGSGSSSKVPDKNNNSGNSSKTTEQGNSSGKIEQIKFMNGFDARFTVIYPTGNDTARDLAAQLSKSIETVLKAEQPYRSDDADQYEYEILIGETNRPASARAYDELRDARTNHADDYVIKMDGKSIVIAAGSDTAMEKAIAKMAGYCTEVRSSVPSNLNFVYREPKQNRMIGSNNIASYVIRTEAYPSFFVKNAAKAFQSEVMALTGYMLPIERDSKSSQYEILIGPNARGCSTLSDINAYEVKQSGNNIMVSTGSTTAADTAVHALIAKMKQGNLANGLSLKGSYDGAYSLNGGYGLTWNDEFSGDKLDRTKWSVMSDTTDGPWYKESEVADKIKNNIGGPWLRTDVSGNPVDSGYVQEGLQTRPGKEGENFFLRDGKLVEVTKKSTTGYDAVRLYTSNKMRYRYGFTEVRIKMGTRNGACSSVWLSLTGNEIDVYENYGLDAYYSNIHTWSPEHIDHVHAGDMKCTWVYPEKGHHFYDEFHYLGFEWTETYIKFYLDGEVTESIDISDKRFGAFRKLIALKLACGVGTGTYSLGNNPGDYMGDKVGDFYETQEVDFVRIYQKDSKKYSMITG